MSYPELGSSICYTPDSIKVVHFGSPSDTVIERRDRHYESDRYLTWNPIVKAKARKLPGRNRK